MHRPDVPLQFTVLTEGLATVLALEVLPLLVHCPDVLSQVAVLAEGLATVLALEVPPLLVHCPDVLPQVAAHEIITALAFHHVDTANTGLAVPW